MKPIKYIFIFFISLLLVFSVKAQIPKVLKHPTRINVKKVNILNSSYRETNLNVSPDGSYIFFMSSRGQQPWSNPTHTTFKGKLQNDGDIWYSKKVGGNWQYPKCMGKPVNTSNGEDEPNISPDGQSVVFQSWDRWRRRKGPYMQSKLNGTRWGTPVGLGGGIHAFFVDLERKGYSNQMATDGATMSADGKTFIVAIGKYDGKMNLYISRKNKYGYWSYLKKMSISTFGDERAPFLAADGRTLYFASDGYGGWGGKDIFKTTINQNGSHGPVINLGLPFNSYLDDYGFILTASGNEAYFVREGDIYFANTTNANKELKPTSSTLMIAGVVTSAKTKRPLGAVIKITDARTGVLIKQVTSNSVTGEYSAIIPIQNNNFKAEVTRTGYNKDSKSFNQTISFGLNKVVSNVALTPLGQPPVVINKPDPKPKQEEEAAAEMLD